MSVWYSLEGTIKVKPDQPDKAIEEIVTRFNEESSSELQAEYDEVNGVVTFSGGGFISHDRACNIDGIAEELSPFTTEPGFLYWDLDHNETGKLFIGNEALREDMLSKEALSQIKELLPTLTDLDTAALIALLTDSVVAKEGK